MTEPKAPVAPEGAPPELKDFFDCKGDVLRWQPGKVTWLGLPVDPQVSFEHGAAQGGVNIKVTIGAPPFGISFSLPAAVDSSGQLTVDTTSIPDGVPGKEALDGWVRDLNAWFRKNGKKLKPAVLKGGAVTLEKTAIAGSPPANAVAGLGGVTAQPTKPAVPAPTPAGGKSEEKQPPGGGWCSLLGLLLLGVIAVGAAIGIGLMSFAAYAPPSSPGAPASASPRPAPTSQATLSTTPARPTAPPTKAPTATPTISPTAPSTERPTAAPSLPVGAVLESVCVWVYHEPLGEFVSFLDFAMWWHGVDFFYLELTIKDANNDDPVQLVFNPEQGSWEGKLGLSAPGTKQIISLIAPPGPGEGTIALTGAAE